MLARLVLRAPGLASPAAPAMSRIGSSFTARAGRASVSQAPWSLWRWMAVPGRRWRSSAASAEAKRLERLDSAPDEEHLPIRALYIGQAVDIARLFRSHYRDMPHAVQRRNVVVTLDTLQEPGVVEIKPWGGGRMIRKRQSTVSVARAGARAAAWLTAAPRRASNASSCSTTMVASFSSTARVRSKKEFWRPPCRS